MTIIKRGFHERNTKQNEGYYTNGYIVNYLSGNIVKNGEVIVRRTGKSTHLTRQTEPHTHFVDKTPDGYLAVCDLGTDTLAFYTNNLELVSETKVPSGYGIRHLVFSKDGRYIYAVNELVPSVSIFTYQNGKAELFNTVKIACKNEKANGTAIRLSGTGKHLYVSLREENAICVFAVDNEKLTLLQMMDCGGDSPRDFNLFQDCFICTNEKSNSVIVFRLDDIRNVAGKETITLKSPLCVF